MCFSLDFSFNYGKLKRDLRDLPNKAKRRQKTDIWSRSEQQEIVSLNEQQKMTDNAHNFKVIMDQNI